MKLIQMIIVLSTYLAVAIAIMIIVPGLIYQLTGYSFWNEVCKWADRQAKNTNDRRKLKYTQIEEYKKVG